MRQPLHPPIGLLLSGGIDSAILLDHLLIRGRRVVPFYVRTDCVWQNCELVAVEQFLTVAARPALEPLVVFDMPLADLYGYHWSITGDSVPDNDSPDDAVFLPGRNPLLLIKPMLWCASHDIPDLAMATLSNNPFDDATSDFFARFESAIGVAAGQRVHVSRPFERLTKADIMAMGRYLPLSLTFSCLSPVHGMHCGCCNKCAERQRAFQRAQMDDATLYANQSKDDARSRKVKVR